MTAKVQTVIEGTMHRVAANNAGLEDWPVISAM
jgi:hypothetical protein